MAAQVAVCDDCVALALRPSLGRFFHCRICVGSMQVEDLTISEYLQFKEKLSSEMPDPCSLPSACPCKSKSPCKLLCVDNCQRSLLVCIAEPHLHRSHLAHVKCDQPCAFHCRWQEGPHRGIVAARDRSGALQFALSKAHKADIHWRRR